jgi:3-hydroxybutyryl-CoA dehydrogenase
MKLDDIKKILIVGAGTMGHGIAQVFASAGYDVWLVDTMSEALDRAAGLIRTSLATLGNEGLVEKDNIPEIMSRIKFSRSFEEGAADADIAIESVVENRETKNKIFKSLDELCPPKTLLASNTTALNIFDFVETSRPDKVLICHWYAPPQLIPLVDIVKGPETDQESIQLMAGLIKKIGKTPLVMNRFSSGYVVSRIQIAMLREIFYLLDNDIVTPEALDDAAKTGLALRMMVLGLVQRMDFGGLDLTYKNMTDPYVQGTLTPMDYKPKKLEELVKAGNLGVKTGKGFYDYKGRSEAELCKERDIKVIRMLKAFKAMEEK